jgi:hypothetical protein
VTIRFRGLFEPWEKLTGDRRAFKSGALSNRDTPLPLMIRSTSGGHEGAETIGMIEKIETGPGGRWYSGSFLDPAVIPAVKKAIYLAKKGLSRPSLDLDRSFTVEPRDWEDGKKAAYFTNGRVIGATLVPMPAFEDITFDIDDDEDGALVASIMTEFATTAAWDSLPIAPREMKFDADDAVKRIAAWAGIGTSKPDTERYASMFLWRGGNQTGTTLAQEDFRLPIGDIGQDGQAYLVYHAIYAAAALLSGGHGGLPNIPDSDKQHIMGVINQIYPKMAQHFNDPRMQSPFAGGDGGQQMSQPAEEFSVERVESAPEGLEVGGGAVDGEAARDGELPLGEIPNQQVTFATATAPSASDFANPNLKRATPLTVIGNRVFGHLGKWGECHLGIGDKCVMLPHSQTDYSLFKVGSVQLDDGNTVRVGKITVGTGHAHPRFGIVPSREHYDNSGWCAAVVNVGEDQFGVWVSGVLVDESKKAELLRSPLSGDWRRYNGNLELVAALAVNSPGFPVFAQEEGEEFSLVAAGVLPLIPEPVVLEVPSSFSSAMTYEEVRASIKAEMERSARFAQMQADRIAERQAERARRLAELASFAPMPAPAPTAQPAAQAPPAAQPPAGQAPAAGQVDLNVDPDADPSTPGIAEVDDPGRDTMLARMADSSYVIVNEETGAEEEPGQFLYKQATETSQKAAQPEQQPGQQQAQAQAQPQAAPQQQPQQAPPPQG